MKKRLLSLVLAASMLLGSVNVAFADETSVPVDSMPEVTAVADDTESSGSVETPSEETTEATEATGPDWATTSPWQATVFGDCGGQARIDGYGDLSSTDAYPNQDGVYVYNVEELGGNSVNVRMGIPDANISQGKIAGSSEGIVYYYQQINADEDYTLSATAHVNGIINSNSQVSFGATVRDTVVPLDGTNSKLVGDSISAAALDMDKFGSTEAGKSLRFAYYRQGGVLTKFDSTAKKNIEAGDDIDISITKNGNNYTLTFGEDVTVVNAEEAGISLTDDVYVGFFASRAADITFNNVKYDNGKVEVGDWTTHGNGLNGKPDSFANLVDNSSADGTTFDLSIIGKAVGKLSSTEDSYFYRAIKTTADEDFSVTANIDEITLGTVSTGNENQMGAGFVVFDKHYVKDVEVEGADAVAADGNSMFVGIVPSAKSSTAPYNLVVRIKKDGNITTNETLISSGLGSVGGTAENISLSVKRSGNTVKVIANDVSKDFDITGVFNNNQYIGYMVARDGNIKVSNNEVTIGSKKPTSVQIETMPEKTQYYATQPFDATGLSFKVTYNDGSTQIISDPNEYSLLGFDDNSNKSFNTKGEKTVIANIGGTNCEFKITVRDMKLIAINVDYTPIYDTFYVGGKFDFTGLQVTAKFENGSSEKLASSEYELYIGDTLIVPGKTTITEDMVSADTAITVKYVEVEGIDSANITGAFNVSIDPGRLTGLEVLSESFKTTFYIGDEYDQRGLVLSGVYTDANGNMSFQRISSDLYTVTGFNSTEVNENLVLKIVYNEDPSIFTTYTIKVLEPSPLATEIEGYPRMTFNTGEAFDATGLVFGIFYSNDEIVTLSEDVYYYKNGTEYYKIYNYNVEDENGEVVYAKNQKVTVTEEELNAADFYIDLTNFDTTNVGTTGFVIYVNEKYGAAAMTPVEFTVTVVETKDYIWKGTIFGASSLGYGGEPSSIVKNYYTTDDKGNKVLASQTTDAKGYGVQPELMENGQLNNVESVRIKSWDGSGKVTNDHDGIAYYYTKVNGSNNFTVSADVTVNKYIFDPDNLPAAQQATYDSYIAQGISPDVALDMLRSGQEAFGIIARDVIPLAGTMQNGKYTGNSNGITNIASEAMTKEYTFTKSDGSTVTYTAPVDALEAQLNNMSVKDEEGNTRLPSAGADAKSNAVFAGAMSDGSWPKDPNSSTYEKKKNINRINIVVRQDGARSGYYATTTKLPEKNEKYNITLTKMNTGYMITTYDYQTDTTSTQYFFDALEETSNTLLTQDKDSIYVGFYAARYGDITVSNIKLHETMTSTDPNISGKVEEAVAPKVTINSPYYTTNENYTLIMKSNSTSGMVGGLTSVSLNGKTVLNDITLGNKKSSFEVQLKPDYVNQFSVVYYPNTADNFTSYDPVITRFTVTHKSESTLNDLKKIYVAPNGSTTGDGTRNNPLTLEMALGIVDYGGQVIMLDGTYNLTNDYVGKISFDEGYSGYQNGNYKSLVADEGANPVIDLEKEYSGFEIDADYWLFKGFSVINSRDNSNGFVLGGNHCVIQDCTFAGNGDTGMQISRVNSDDKDITTWPSYNAIISCESYNNADPNGNNADGFAAKLTVGYGNVFEDCISHHNVDDGWDLYTKGETGAIGPVVLENCITYKNGMQIVNEETGEEANYAKYEGNGFKLGGESIYVEHMLKDSISFENKGSGVNSNNNPAMKIRNVVSYNNEDYNFNLHSGATEILVDSNGNTKDSQNRTYKYNYDIKGAVSYGTSDTIGSWNSDVTFGNISTTPIDSETNYLAKSGGIGVNSLGEAVDPSTFFKSVDKTVSLGTNQRYTRNADGSFKHGDFLARTDEYAYEQDAADAVTLPDVLGGKGGVGLGTTTEATTSEVTTSAPSKGSSGAGGSGKVTNYTATTTTTTEATTSVEEDTTEATTEAIGFTDSVSVQVGSKDIVVNDTTYTMDVAPYIQTSSNSTMVPLRFVSIALAGDNVSDADNSNLIVWDAATKTATITAGSNTIVFTAGSGTYTVNGSTLNISNQAVAEIVDGRMFVPFRTIGEALGADVSWDANTKTAMYN